MKTVVNHKSVNLGMISARHTTNRQSFKKVTCPFKLMIYFDGWKHDFFVFVFFWAPRGGMREQ